MEDTHAEELNQEELNVIRAMYPILRYFDYSHLPASLAAVSRPIAFLAYDYAAQLPPHSPEVSAGLRKLLEAKDCFVRAKL